MDLKRNEVPRLKTPVIVQVRDLSGNLLLEKQMNVWQTDFHLHENGVEYVDIYLEGGHDYLSYSADIVEDEK